MPRTVPTLRPPGTAEARARAQKQRQRDLDRRRGSAHKRGYTRQWAAYAARYKLRHPLCVHCAEDGIDTLTEAVDHIQPVSGPDDPLFWDEDNHQSLCRTCHSRKTAREDGGFRGLEPGLVFPDDLKPSRPLLTLVCGPPAAGKTTWVADQAEAGDVVIDLDGICADIAGTSVRGWPLDVRRRAMMRRNTLLRGLADSAARRAWFIVTGAQQGVRARWAEALGARRIVLVLADRATCAARIRADAERAPVADSLIGAVEQWHAAFASGLGEQIVRTDRGIGG
ncbi:MAG: AAA family ATPase [Dichotomicrobium sp.]